MKKLLSLILVFLLSSCTTIILPDAPSSTSSLNSTTKVISELSKEMEQQIIYDYYNTYYSTVDDVYDDIELCEAAPLIIIEQFYGAYNDFYLVKMNVTQNYFTDCYEIIGDFLFLFSDRINIIVYHDGDFLDFNETFGYEHAIQENISLIHQLHCEYEPLNKQFNKQIAEQIKKAFIHSELIDNVVISNLYDIIDSSYFIEIYIAYYCGDDGICEAMIELFPPIIDDVLIHNYYYKFVYNNGVFYSIFEAYDDELIGRESLLKIGIDIYQHIKTSYYYFKGCPSESSPDDVTLLKIWNSNNGSYAFFISLDEESLCIEWQEIIENVIFYYFDSARISLWYEGTFFTLTEAYEHRIITLNEIYEIAFNYGYYGIFEYLEEVNGI